MASGAIALASIVAATPAFATPWTHLGQVHENYFCNGSYQWIQTASAGPSYVVPAGDTRLFRWSTNGGVDAGTMQLEIWAPAGGNDYTLVYISAPTVLQAGTFTRVDVTPGVKVTAGDVIGYRSVTDTDCAMRTGNSGDVYMYDPGSSTPTVGSTVGFQGPATGFRFNIAATVN
jgi:hypothetical protein